VLRRDWYIKILFLTIIFFSACSQDNKSNINSNVKNESQEYRSCKTIADCPSNGKSCTIISKLGKSVCISGSEACRIDCKNKTCVIKTSNPGLVSCGNTLKL